MGWKRELLEDTAKQYDTPCPNCCKFRLGPMAEDGADESMHGASEVCARHGPPDREWGGRVRPMR